MSLTLQIEGSRIDVMRYSRILLLAFSLGLVLTHGSGCVTPGGAGGLLLNYYDGPFLVTGNNVGTKRGEGTIQCFLGLACFGDGGISNIARRAQIQKISTVDYEYISVISFLYTSTTIIVTGE